MLLLNLFANKSSTKFANFGYFRRSGIKISGATTKILTSSIASKLISNSSFWAMHLAQSTHSSPFSSSKIVISLLFAKSTKARKAPLRTSKNP